MATKQASSGIDRSQIEEIKQRLNIEDIVKRYVKLKPVGRNLFGLCPFHKEDTPSFSVNPEMNIYKCFGCGETGDVIEFLIKVENIEFYEALEQLAKEAGVKLKIGKKDPAQERRYSRAKEAHNLASKYFYYILQKHDLGEAGRKYAKERGLSSTAIKNFQIGFAPPFNPKSTLISFLGQKGYKPAELKELGLVSERQGKLGDKFSSRLMFPIFSTTGEVIAFSGRTIYKDEKRPKYLNSPETVIFQKRRNLFGLYQAKKAIKDDDFAIIVEGSTDVISSNEVGVKNIVAPLGTGINEGQIEKLKRYTQNIALAFDKDTAGQSAAIRASEIAYQLGFNVTVIEIPAGKDADECIRKDPNLWKSAVKSKIPAITYFTNKILGSHPKNSLEAKQEIVRVIFPVITSISDSVIKDHHIKELSLITDIDEKVIKEKTKRVISEKDANHLIDTIKKQKAGVSLEIYLLSLILQHSECLSWLVDKLNLEEFQNQKVKHLINSIFEMYRNNKNFSISDFVDRLEGLERQLGVDSLMRPIWSSDPDIKEITDEINETIHNIRENLIRQEIADLKNNMATAEQSGKIKKANEILNLINSKIKDLEALN